MGKHKQQNKLKKKAKALPAPEPEFKAPEPVFKVPKSIYMKVLEEIKKPNPIQHIQKQHHNNHVSLDVQHLCHSDSKETYSVSSKNGLNKIANFQKAAKEALDLRDFKAVYKICMKGFELKDKVLSRVLYEVINLKIIIGLLYFKNITFSTSTSPSRMILCSLTMNVNFILWKQLGDVK
jgi:hypothetical protein